MARCCSVPGCKSQCGKEGHEEISFHNFPKNDKMRQAWMDNLQKKNPDGTPWEPFKNSKICSLHFAACCFKKSSESNKKLQRRILLPTALPTKKMVVPNYHLKHRSAASSSVTSGSLESCENPPANDANSATPSKIGSATLTSTSLESEHSSPQSSGTSVPPPSRSSSSSLPNQSSSNLPPHLVDHPYASFQFDRNNNQSDCKCKKLQMRVCKLVKEKKTYPDITEEIKGEGQSSPV